ncbi:MAG: class I SAM-dependent methyltransferase [Thermoactinomycetaceae bacterium]|jgi:SAM-dependent methyltransferase|nr:class I SAM-dependent methyltransferase [Bacillota bacterium]MBO2532940.1 class I SAM-dependent methyltransferase [Thermoactinomycetaceae bacterium]
MDLCACQQPREETRVSEWFEESFGEDYLLVYRHRTMADAEDEVDAIVEWLDLSPKDHILDLCCGTGRHSIALARRGYRVTGLDLSETLLSHAVALSKGLPVRFVHGDMRSLPFSKEMFDVVLNLFTSFGYFVEDRDNERVLAEIRRVLKPGGRFLIDFLNRPAVLRSLVPVSEREEDGVKIREERWIEGDVVCKRIFVSDARGERRYEERVKMYSRDQMEEMMRRAGLSVQQVWGDFEGNPHTERSRRMIIAGRRPE